MKIGKFRRFFKKKMPNLDFFFLAELYFKFFSINPITEFVVISNIYVEKRTVFGCIYIRGIGLFYIQSIWKRLNIRFVENQRIHFAKLPIFGIAEGQISAIFLCNLRANM